jgi:glycosyltransferase involved in cell wall biosynthesis
VVRLSIDASCAPAVPAIAYDWSENGVAPLLPLTISGRNKNRETWSHFACRNRHPPRATKKAAAGNHMRNKGLIVLFATQWGRKFGGINSFNYDFSCALGAALTSSYKTVCVVATATTEEVRNARSVGVTLVSPPKRVALHQQATAAEVLREVRRHGVPLVLVGHDVITGAAARDCARALPEATLALLHHMNYFDYQAIKSLDGGYAAAQAEEQRSLFASADRLFAVGPMLRDSLARDLDIAPRRISTLIPGLDGIVPARRLPPRLTAISFGRLDPANERIKQGLLAAAGFALACKRAQADPALPDLLRAHPTLVLVGVERGSREESELHELIEHHGDGARNLLALPFIEDRQQLLLHLRRASVALFLSWYDGFGLAAWEAIAAGVPLILSRNCGAYQMVREILGGQGLGCISSVVIGGSARKPVKSQLQGFTLLDVQNVAQALLECAAHPAERRRDALNLRSLLLDRGCTWDRCARDFARALRLKCRAV